MSRLIKNEFKKLFSRKLMYVLFIIIIGAAIMANLLYNTSMSYIQNENLEQSLAYYDKELKSTDYKKEEQNSYYINIKTEYDLTKLKLEYAPNSWQNNFMNNSDTVYLALNEINQNTYGLNKDSKKLQEAQEKFQKIKERLDSGDWKSFVSDQLNTNKEEIAFYEEQLKSIKDKNTVEEIKQTIEMSKITQQTLEWRLEKNITYDNSFLSSKIEEYTFGAQSVKRLENKENRTKEEEHEYQESLKQMSIAKYYIENNIQIENEYDARYVLSNLTNEYGIFIVIFSIIVAGTIVSNEFQKGTIKLLLTRPYSRNKILFSKFIVSIICIFIFIIIFIIAQYFIGGIIYGFDVFNIPEVEYNFNTNSIVVIPVLQYMSIKILCVLPMYILLTTLAFALSTITMNSSIAIAIPILGYMVSDAINIFIDRVKLLKYFVTANWDLSVYLFGGQGIAEGLNFWLSIAICCVYLVIMLVVAFIVFKKRDIKNV